MNDQTLAEEGLNPRTIATHIRRIRGALSQDNSPTFSIEDTCRLDNGGIVRFDRLPQCENKASIAAFIPAAGAATRYSKVLVPLLSALETKTVTEIEKAARALKHDGALQWPLPESVKAIIQNPQRIDEETWAKATNEILQPKALQPCVIDHPVSFLQMKDIEHSELQIGKGQVFVTPHEQSQEFLKHLGKTENKTVFLEQGPNLSTVRIKPDGELFLENGRPSIVPAGHGALAELFPIVKDKLPGVEAVLIRNIDNVIGAQSYTVKGVKNFANGFSFVFENIKGIRQALSEGNIEAAEASAKVLGSVFDLPYRGSWLMTVMQDLFHTACLNGDIDELTALYARPLNVFGQVPNLSNDIGGTPCFVNHRGKRLKVCLEVPHASEADQRNFLANPAKATHFNPVFVFAELTDQADYYGEKAEDFWLLANKTHAGNPVLYHESVLYELIGNSETSNCLFVEIPRFLFHPRKYLADGKDQTLEKLLPLRQSIDGKEKFSAPSTS